MTIYLFADELFPAYSIETKPDYATAVKVDKRTVKRWKRIEADYLAMQTVMGYLVDKAKGDV